MDYEQKYKEALSRARDLHDNHPLGQPQTWMTCEKIFPELKESEDERIKKELISFITDRKNWFLKEETKSSWISWLENQGHDGKKWIYEDVYLKDRVQPQLKQEWSKEDERIYNEIIDFFLGDIGTRCTTIDKQRHFGYWLKSIKPNHWKPTEEQMMTLCALCVLHKESKVLESLYNDLKSL